MSRIFSRPPCLTVGLSRHHDVPLQWCSAYIPSCRFSSSVTLRQLHDDLHHHSIRWNARSTYSYGGLQSFPG